MKKRWSEKSIEIASLFNPAFCGIVLFEFLKGYEEFQPKGPEFPIVFLVLPLVLQEKIRMKLNGCNASTRLQRWIQQNPEIKISFDFNVINTVDITKDAILFGTNRSIFQLNELGRIESVNRQLKARKWGSDDERKDIIQKAKLLGKWFGQLDDSRFIFELLGVRP